MSPSTWFTIFAVLALLIAAVAVWMAWFSRRMVRQHRHQVEDILREMRSTIDERRGSANDTEERNAE